MGVAVKRLIKGVKRIAREAERLQSAAIDMAADLAIIDRALADDSSGRLETVVELALLRAEKAKREAALRAASVGAWKVEMRFKQGGAAVVRVDEGKWFKLSRGDARLLRVLTQSGPIEADGFPVWLTWAQVAEELGRKTGVTPTRHALVESVYRIRQALQATDNNRYLLKVDRKMGRLRFLLRAGRPDRRSQSTSGRAHM